MEDLNNPNFKLFYNINKEEIALYDSDKIFLDSWGIDENLQKEEPNFYVEVLASARKAETVQKLIDLWMFDGHIVEKEKESTNRIELTNKKNIYILMY